MHAGSDPLDRRLTRPKFFSAHVEKNQTLETLDPHKKKIMVITNYVSSIPGGRVTTRSQARRSLPNLDLAGARGVRAARPQWARAGRTAGQPWPLFEVRRRHSPGGGPPARGVGCRARRAEAPLLQQLL